LTSEGCWSVSAVQVTFAAVALAALVDFHTPPDAAAT
jgi:hypothetical protein